MKRPPLQDDPIVLPDKLVLILKTHPSPHRYSLSISPASETDRWTLQLKVPRGTTNEKIRKILGRHRRWIQNRLLHLTEMAMRSGAAKDIPPDSGEGWTGSTVPVNGFFVPITLVSLPDRDREDPAGRNGRIPYLSGQNLCIPDPSDLPGDHWQEKVRRFMMDSFLTRIRTILLVRCPEMALYPTRVVVRNTHRQWGSMNRRGTMSLSFRLAFLADHDVDLVIVHELCHIAHPNHGPLFQSLLSGLIPDHRIGMKKLSSFPSMEEWLFRSPLPGPAVLSGRDLPVPNRTGESSRRSLEEKGQGVLG